MKKIIFWDFDGTLGYRDGNWEAAIFEVADDEKIKTEENYTLVSHLLQEGFPWHTPEKNFVFIANASDWWQYVKPKFTQIFEVLGYNKVNAQVKAAQVPMQYSKLEKWKIYDDVIPNLNLLRLHNWENVLVTNNVPEFNNIIEGLHINEYFDKVFISAVAGFNKPNPLIINGYLDNIGKDAQIIVVGDRAESDVAFAENIHAKGLLVRTDAKKEGHLCFDNLTGLTKYILSH